METCPCRRSMIDICGMRVGPGDIIHMDENGAVKFPREYLDDVLEKATAMQKIESKMQERLAKADSGKEVDDILNGLYK